jgi:hypothetical protein
MTLNSASITRIFHPNPQLAAHSFHLTEHSLYLIAKPLVRLSAVSYRRRVLLNILSVK